MKPPPPRLPAAGYTTASAKATAIAASTALPPRRRTSTPTCDASLLVEATMPCRARTGSRDDGLSEFSSEARAAELRSHIQALHFAHTVVNPSQRDAARRAFACAREQESARGRRVVAGQSFQLLLEILKAEVNADRRLVLAEQTACLFDVLDSFGLIEFH